jgi:hypothetical protein
MIIGVPDFLYCCILLIIFLCHSRSPNKKTKKTKTIKNAKTDCKKTENKFLKMKKNIYISNELMHIIALILILEI